MLNPYDNCVANKIINGSQFTIVWHVDDLKLSHVDPDEVTKIIDLLSLRSPQVIGYIYGGLVSDAPNNGNTRAAAEIFSVILEPVPVPAPLLSIALTAPDGISLSWPVENGVRYLFEQSPGLNSWTELWPPPVSSPVNLSTGGAPRNFFRLHGRTPVTPQP